MHRMTALIVGAASLLVYQDPRQPREIRVPTALSGTLVDLDSKIAFTSNRDQRPEPKNFEPAEMYLMNGDGSDQRRLTKTDWNEGASDWSPNGTRIAFHGNKLCGAPWTGPCTKSGIFLMNAFDPAEQILLTNLGQKEVGAELGVHFPAWSPNGQQIAFNSWGNANGSGVTPPRTRDVFVINADGSGPTRLTNNAASDRGPKWSHNGTKIAFESNRDGNWEIYLVSATDGSEPINLTNDAAEDANPAWSPDSGM